MRRLLLIAAASAIVLVGLSANQCSNGNQSQNAPAPVEPAAPPAESTPPATPPAEPPAETPPAPEQPAQPPQ